MASNVENNNNIGDKLRFALQASLHPDDYRYAPRYSIYRPDALPGMDPKAMTIEMSPERQAAARLAIADVFNEIEAQGDGRPTWTTETTPLPTDSE